VSQRIGIAFCIFLAVGGIIGEILLLTGHEQQKYSQWLESEDYRIESGLIKNLVLKQKLWKSDPVPTFEVNTARFEYGVFSRNDRLLNYLEGGPLRENRQVSVWHHEGKIVRLYAAD